MKDYRDCPYWKETGCSGFNCCLEVDCKHAEKYHPWLKKAEYTTTETEFVISAKGEEES